MRTRPLLVIVGLVLIGASPARGQERIHRFDGAELRRAALAGEIADHDAAPTAAPATPAAAARAPASGPTPLALEPAVDQSDGGFETTGFAQFIASPAGRILRGVVGAGMIAGGVALGDTGGAVLAVAGAVPLSAGVFDLCYVSALLGGPIRGEEIREAGRDGG